MADPDPFQLISHNHSTGYRSSLYTFSNTTSLGNVQLFNIYSKTKPRGKADAKLPIVLVDFAGGRMRL